MKIGFMASQGGKGGGGGRGGGPHSQRSATEHPPGCVTSSARSLKAAAINTRNRRHSVGRPENLNDKDAHPTSNHQMYKETGTMKDLKLDKQN